MIRWSDGHLYAQGKMWVPKSEMDRVEEELRQIATKLGNVSAARDQLVNQLERISTVVLPDMVDATEKDRVKIEALRLALGAACEELDNIVGVDDEVTAPWHQLLRELDEVGK